MTIGRNLLRLAGALGLTLVAHAAVAEDYTVQRGDSIVAISHRNKISPMSVILANQEYLEDKYDETCGKRSDAFRKRTGPRTASQGGSYFCNDTKARPFANTLKPGWLLEIPSTATPPSINSTVEQIKGNHIAIVIDRTESMSDKIKDVAIFYVNALQKYERNITGVFLFTGYDVQRLNTSGVKTVAEAIKAMNTEGGRENTHQALMKAAEDKPDAIILITDEQGDDWNWSEIDKAPPPAGHRPLPPDQPAIGRLREDAPASRHADGRHLQLRHARSSGRQPLTHHESHDHFNALPASTGGRSFYLFS